MRGVLGRAVWRRPGALRTFLKRCSYCLVAAALPLCLSKSTPSATSLAMNFSLRARLFAAECFDMPTSVSQKVEAKSGTHVVQGFQAGIAYPSYHWGSISD